jgi:hypothetical protein
MIPKVQNVGEVIASRDLSFNYNDGRTEIACLKVGKPVEDTENESWYCSYEISTESYKKVFAMVGIDPLQALELTMKTLSVEVEYWGKSKKGKFYFLDEEGAGI